MSWVTIVWAMSASASLTLGAEHLLVWCKKRAAWASLLFALVATTVAAMAAFELCQMRAETPGQLGRLYLWYQVPIWAITLSFASFVRVQLRAGRPWLWWTVCGLRTVALFLNFLTGQNLNYLEMTRVRHIHFLGESVSIAAGVPNPWMLVGQLSVLFFVIFVVDAAVSVWRRGDHRVALTVGGSLIFFVLSAGVHGTLTLWHVIASPMLASIFGLPVLAAMAYEMTRDVLRAGELAEVLRESEKRFRATFEQAAVGVAHISPEGRFLRVNQKYCDIAGYSRAEMLERTYQDITHPDDRAEDIKQVNLLLSGESDSCALEKRYISKNGELVWVNLTAAVVRDGAGRPQWLIAVVEDIGGRKQAERENEQQRNQLAHLSRVATVSELSSSLAHELNQPLAIILTNAQAAQRLLVQQPPDVAEARDILTDIVSEDQRAGEVIRRLRSLLKQGQTSLTPLDLNETIRGVLHLTHSDLIWQSVTVHPSLAGNLPLVSGDYIQLQQVLLNLILNACDAMAANSPENRHLTLATAHCEGAVRVSVSDNGCGPPPDATRIFEPFYTTKKQGLGLGLSICTSIVRAHKGRLWVEGREAADGPHGAAARGGATFHLELRAVNGAKP